MMGQVDIAPEDAAAVTALTRAAGTSFYRGMTVLNRDRRTAMYAVYQFCRIVDDIADEPAPLDEKRAGLDAWRNRIAALYQGDAGDATTRVLRAAISRYALRQEDFLAIIDGMEMDAGDPIIAPPYATLDLYCDRVASAVGRLSVRIFGEPSPAGDEVAHHLGRALQLTNILRDVGEDAARGRVYLPRETLIAEEVPLDPDRLLAAPRLRHVLVLVAARAEHHFAQAEAAMRRCDARAMRPARMMAAAYRPLLGVMRAKGFAAPEIRPSLPRWRKLLLAAQLLIYSTPGL
jgi:squalene synthase HpnD